MELMMDHTHLESLQLEASQEPRDSNSAGYIHTMATLLALQLLPCWLCWLDCSHTMLMRCSYQRAHSTHSMEHFSMRGPSMLCTQLTK